MIEQANEIIQTLFAETAILLTHPNEGRRHLAKDRVFAVLFAPRTPAVERSLTLLEKRLGKQENGFITMAVSDLRRIAVAARSVEGVR